jgi:hypothetical protein
MTMVAVTEPLPFRLLVDEAIKLTRRHFRQMYLPVALPVALAQSLVPVAQSFVFSHGLFSPSPDPAAAVVGMLGFFVVALLAGAFWGLGYGALLVAATEAQSGAGVSMGRAWRTMLRPRVLGTSVLVALSFLVGCAMCVLPGILLALLFSLAVPVMVAERIYGTTALARAAALVRENPEKRFASSPLLKVFLILVIGYVLSAAVGLVIQMPLIVVQQLVIFRSAAAGEVTDPATLMSKMTLFQVPASFLNVLAATAVQIYIAFALTLFYFDLRRRQEGSDLEAAVREMAGRQPEPPPVAG